MRLNVYGQKSNNLRKGNIALVVIVTTALPNGRQKNTGCVVTDDIVTRLRRMDASIPSVDPDKYVSPTDAADEIERLRADVKRWRNWAEEFFYTDPECECPLCDQVRAAIEKTVRP